MLCHLHLNNVLWIAISLATAVAHATTSSTTGQTAEKTRTEDRQQQLGTTHSTQLHRRNMPMPFPDHHQEMLFSPLQCNDDIMDQPCTSWSSYFGSGINFDETVIIPCGECVILDPLSLSELSQPLLELTFNEGLSIVGRLLLPNIGDSEATKIRITTKSLVVEGILSIYESDDGTTMTAMSDGEKVQVPATPDGTSKLEIHLFGGEDGERSFIPHQDNMHACPDLQGCNIGKLPFVVAGGRLDIHAMPTILAVGEGGEEQLVECPTWTDLVEVATGGAPNPQSFPLAPALPSGCSESGTTFLAFNSQSSESSNWLDAWDAGDSIPTVSIDSADNSFQIIGRTKSTQGPRVQLFPSATSSALSCQQTIQADVPYLLTAQIKITALDGYGPSSCETTGKCLYLQLQKIGRYNKSTFRTIDFSKYWPKAIDGEYFEYRTVVFIKQEEIDEVNLYHGGLYLKLLGVPAPGYNINIKQFDLSMASYPELYPDPTNVCQNLISNGDFSTGQYYPWKARSGGSLLIKEDEKQTGDKYLRHAGRTPVYPGLEQTLVPGCLEKDIVYDFSMKARVHTDIGATIILKLVLTDASTGSIKYRDFLRPAKQYSSSGWVTITKTFSVTEEMASAIDVKLITMISEGSPATTVDYDDIKIEFQHGVGQELLVDNPYVAECWGPGGEILITPSTNQYTDSTVVNIVDTSTKLYQGKEVGVIKFDGEAGFHPTFANADSRTRAEVALLTRHVMVTATPDPNNSLHGGHLIVLHTANVTQHLEGVQFRGMGQQGNLGRYPIHFHISHDVSGSVIKANSIIESNQRCIVIHGSHGAIIESNIAYNTKGHCFMKEDGNEFGNIFRKNLGALTLPVETANLLSSVDTDHNPSTFWMPTPRNSLIGNVAAGSKGSGYWFEVEGFFRGASQNAPEVLDGSLMLPSRQDLQPYVFEANKAHSNEGSGMKTYPSGGWKPPNEAIFSNFVSYRNRGAGSFSHNGLNQSYIGGYFADNQYIGIDIDRSYQGRIKDVTIVGYSAEYEALVTSPGNQGGIEALSPCGYNNRVQRGIQIHASKSGGSANVGYQISNITFERFGYITGCWDSAAFDVDSREDSGYFDPRTSFKSIEYENVDEASRINLCDTQSGGIDYINIETEEGYVISDNPLLSTFPDLCSPLADGAACAQVCPQTCIRSLKVSVPSANVPTTTKLKVLDTVTNRFIEIPGEWDMKMMSDPEWYMLTAFYRAYLPVGVRYEASFIDSESGLSTWPTFVDTIYEDTDPDGCDNVQLDYSYDDSGDPKDCDQLVQNRVGAWLHSGGGVYSLTEDGFDDLIFENRDRDSYGNGLVQYVDTRCFDAGATYHFKAKVMLLDENGNSLDCDPSARECPIFRLNSSGGPPGTTTVYNEFFGFSTWSSNTWNDANITITISEDEASKSKSMIHIYGSPEAWSLRIKDVSMSRISSSTTI